jgi:hypothetical protein
VGIQDRSRIRRQMAQASMLLTWIIVLAFLFGLSSDSIAARVEKVWPPFAVLFPSLMGYLGWYAKLGHEENKIEMERSS